MKYIKLTNCDLTTIVDDEDYITILKEHSRKWSLNGHGYAGGYSSKLKKHCLLHRAILNDPPQGIIDHINRNKLDNRKENLRIISKSLNSLNTDSKPFKSKNHSKFRGVSKIRNSAKWMAQIKVNQKMHYLGLFIKEIDAALAYNKAAIKYFGDFAKLNNI